MYQHRGGAPGWEGARLGWTGVHWALRRTNGALLVFQPCGGRGQVYSVTRARDEDGHATHYRRDRQGRLMAIESGDRWIKREGRCVRQINCFSDTQRRCGQARHEGGRL